MPIKIPCTACGRPASVPDWHTQPTFPCPICGTPLKVKQGAAGGGKTAHEPAVLELPEPESEAQSEVTTIDASEEFEVLSMDDSTGELVTGVPKKAGVLQDIDADDVKLELPSADEMELDITPEAPAPKQAPEPPPKPPVRPASGVRQGVASGSGPVQRIAPPGAAPARGPGSSAANPRMNAAPSGHVISAPGSQVVPVSDDGGEDAELVAHEPPPQKSKSGQVPTPLNYVPPSESDRGPAAPPPEKKAPKWLPLAIAAALVLGGVGIWFWMSANKVPNLLAKGDDDLGKGDSAAASLSYDSAKELEPDNQEVQKRLTILDQFKAARDDAKAKGGDAEQEFLNSWKLSDALAGNWTYKRAKKTKDPENKATPEQTGAALTTLAVPTDLGPAASDPSGFSIKPPKGWKFNAKESRFENPDLPSEFLSARVAPIEASMTQVQFADKIQKGCQDKADLEVKDLKRTVVHLGNGTDAIWMNYTTKNANPELQYRMHNIVVVLAQKSAFATVNVVTPTTRIDKMRVILEASMRSFKFEGKDVAVAPPPPTTPTTAPVTPAKPTPTPSQTPPTPAKPTPATPTPMLPTPPAKTDPKPPIEPKADPKYVTVYVMKDGRRIRSKMAIDAGDTWQIKDDTGKTMSLAKTDVDKIVHEMVEATETPAPSADPGTKPVAQYPVYVLANGQRITAKLVIDAGDSYSIKDENGRLTNVPKKDVVEILKP